MKSKHTRGFFESLKSSQTSAIKVTEGLTDTVNVDGVSVAIVAGHSDEESEANAQLIADAFNVTQETNMTPRELQKSHAELLEALKGMINTFKGKGMNGHLDKLSILNSEQAIKNATK